MLAEIACTVANRHRNPKHESRAYTPLDFMPYTQKTEKKPAWKRLKEALTGYQGKPHG